MKSPDWQFGDLIRPYDPSWHVSLVMVIYSRPRGAQGLSLATNKRAYPIGDVGIVFPHEDWIAVRDDHRR